MSYKHLPKQAQLFLNEYEEILASFEWMKDVLDEFKKAIKIRYNDNTAYVKINKGLIEELLKKTDVLQEVPDDIDIVFEWER